MFNALQTDKTYKFRRTYLHNLAMVIGTIAIIYFSTMLYITIKMAGGFIPTVHLLIIAMIVIMVLIVSYSISPATYVRILNGEIKVRQKYLGGWKSLNLGELETVQNRNETIYLLSAENLNKKLEINLESLNIKDAEELQNLLEEIIRDNKKSVR